MENKSLHFLKLVGTTLAMTLVVSLIVLLIGLIIQWENTVQFSNGFFIAGAIVIILGLLSVAGGFAQRANFNMTYADSAGQASLSERAQRTVGEINQRYGFMTLFGAVGILLIVISILIS